MKNLTDMNKRHVHRLPYSAQYYEVFLQQYTFTEFTPDLLVYYALNKILSSDWLNTSLTLGDVWSVENNVRPVANSKRISHFHISCLANAQESITN